MKNDDISIENILELIVTKGSHIPKYQVERILSPFLQLVLPDALTNYYHKKGGDYSKGAFEMICPEFPILKEGGSKQSTNIDYLMYHEYQGDRTAIFIELKTDLVSLGTEQRDIYLKLSKKNPKWLVDNLKVIRDNSNRKAKYDYLINENADEVLKCDKKNGIKTIYIFPGYQKRRGEMVSVRELMQNPPGKVWEGWKGVEFVSLGDIADHLKPNHSTMFSALKYLDKPE